MAVDGSLNFDTRIDPNGFNKGTKKLTSSVKKLGTILAAVFGAGIIKIASDFEYAMAEVQASTGAVGESFEALIDKAKEMGKTTKFTATESANAMKFMGLAGWSTTQIIDGLADVMDLSAASGEDLSLISDIVTDAMTALGISAKKTGEFVDLLAAASSNSNSTIALFGESFRYASNIAGSLGVTARDTAFALGLMANSGVKASMSGTALRTTLTKLNNPAGKTKEVLDRFGIEIARNDDLSLNFGETITNLRKSFGKMNKQQKSVNAELLVGKIAMGGLLGIVNASDESYNKLTVAIDNMTGKAKEMAEIKLNTLQGQLDLLKSAFSGVALEIGEVLIPVFKTLIKGFIIPAVAWFSELIAQLKSFYTAMGITTKKQIAQSTSVTQSIKDNEKAQEGVTGAVDDTNEALKNSLAGFDEVNVLQKEAKENAEEGIGVAGINVSTETTPEPELDEKKIGEELEISPNVQRIIDLLKPLTEIDFTPLNTALTNFKLVLEPLGAITLKGLSWLYTNVLLPLSTWTIEDFIPAFLETLASAITLLTPALEELKPLANWLWIEFLQPLSSWAGAIIVDTLNLLTDALTSLSEWAAENQSTISGITTTLVIFFGLWKVTELLAFIQMSGGLALAFTTLATAIWATVAAKIADKTQTIALNLLYAKDFVVSIAKTIVKIGVQTVAYIANKLAILAVKTQTLAYIVVQKVGLVKAMILSAIQIVKNTVVLVAQKIALIASKIAQIAMNVATLAWNVICAIATTVTTAFAVAVAFLTSPIGLVILAIVALVAIIVLLYKNWDKVKEIAGIVWEYIKKKWSQFSAWIKENVTDPVAKFFKELWDGIKEAFTKTFDSIKTAFKTIVNTYVDIWEGFFNLVIKGINFLINKLNTVKFDIPEWMGGGEFGFNIGNIENIKIPRLATGAVIPPNSEFLAVLGDQKNGTNIETPLATMVEAFKMAMGENGGNGDVTIEFTGSLAQLGKVLKPVIDKEKARQGRSKVVTGGAF